MTATPTGMTAGQARVRLEPLFDARSDAIWRLNKAQNSDSLATKKRAAAAAAEADDELVRALVQEEWPQEIRGDVKRLVTGLNREYPILTTLSEVKSAETFYNVTMRNLVPKGPDRVAAAIRSIMVRLGML